MTKPLSEASEFFSTDQKKPAGGSNNFPAGRALCKKGKSQAFIRRYNRDYYMEYMTKGTTTLPLLPSVFLFRTGKEKLKWTDSVGSAR